MDKIRVVLADNHPTFLAGLKQFVDEEDELVYLATANDGESAVRAACKLIPDVIVLDVCLNCQETFKRFRSVYIH
jgi:DNA-binding NarL/FixJ family response regulator